MTTLESRGAGGPISSATGVVNKPIPYSSLDFDTPTINHPSEFHQATVHFVLEPTVPLRWKLYYLSVSAFTLFLQGVALFGLMSDIEAKTTHEILSLYRDMNPLDWWMSCLVGILTAFAVQSELSQSRLAEVMIKHAIHSDDEEEARTATKWSFPLLLIMRRS